MDISANNFRRHWVLYFDLVSLLFHKLHKKNKCCILLFLFDAIIVSSFLIVLEISDYKFMYFTQARLASIADQWEFLTQKTTEKSLKLKEANKQRTYIAAVKDLDFWLGEVESLLTSEDSGKDLASVQNLMKKHQLVEADIQAHEDRINGEYCL